MYGGEFHVFQVVGTVPAVIGTENETYNRKFADLEARLDRQRVLDAKLTVLEDEIEQIKQIQKWVEQRDAR